MSELPIFRFLVTVLLFVPILGTSVHAAEDPASLRRVTVASLAALTAAIDDARPGDEIVVADGTYDIRRLRLKASGRAEQPILLRAEKRGAVQIRATDTIAFSVTGAYWTIDGLDIRGVCATQAKCEHAFHITGNADGTVIRNNRMRDFNATIKGNGNGQGKPGNVKDVRDIFPDHVLIADNYIFNTAVRETAGPVALIDVVGGQGWIIRHNFVADFQKGKGNKVSYGMSLKGNSSQGVIERNLVMCEWRNKGGSRLGISLGGGGTGKKYCERQNCTVEHTDGIIRNNIVLNCTQDVGVYLNKAKNSKIYNNTIINTRGIDIRFKASTADLRNNIVSGKIRERDGGTRSEINNLVHPHQGTLMNIFVDVAKGNFRLLDEGEVLGKGRQTPEVMDDFCGRPRVLPAYDLGAIEYGPGRCNTTRMMRDAETFSRR